MKYLGGEIRFEIDHFGIDQIEDAATGANAATSPGTWSADINTYHREWVWHKFSFNDFVEKGANAIFAKTLRATCNFIIGGNDVIRVIKQLKPDFVPAPGLGTTAPTGPHVVGTLNGRLVVHDPFLTSARAILGYRGDDYLMAGFIYAPYIPLFATPTLITSDLEAQKGFQSSSGFLVTNPGMFTYMAVSGLS